jgi:hypothetical protein
MEPPLTVKTCRVLPQCCPKQSCCQTKARASSPGVWIEDKASGMVLLQQAIRRGWPAQYLIQKVDDIFKRWDAETAGYSATIRLISVDGTERHLRQFVHTIIQHSLKTDRSLRGMGYPENITHIDSSVNMSRADAEISRLACAHRALLDEKLKKETAAKVLSTKQRFETFLSNHKGILSLIGILVAIVLGGLKLLFG